MINNNLKYCREELEMTQTELGYVFGVSKQTVSGWKTTTDTIPFNKLIKFSNLYNYSLDFICGLSRKNIKYNTFKCDKLKIENNLKKIRRELNITQQQLCDNCGLSQTTYSGYETGKYLINTITIYSICKKYKVSMDKIIGRKEK